MVPVQILGVHLDPHSDMSLVLLGEVGEVTRVLPIRIGPAEAQAIVIGMAGATPPRPGTHDLMVEMMRHAGVELVGVDVTELREGTFIAELLLETPNGSTRMSARPSDGIALAVRFGVRIAVDAVVLDEAAVTVEHEPDMPFAEAEIEAIVGEFQEFLATAEPSDFAGEQPDFPPVEHEPEPGAEPPAQEQVDPGDSNEIGEDPPEP